VPQVVGFSRAPVQIDGIEKATLRAEGRCYCCGRKNVVTERERDVLYSETALTLNPQPSTLNPEL
jgi:hypothetical protein